MDTTSTLPNYSDAQPTESSLSEALQGKVSLMIAQPPEFTSVWKQGYEWAREKVDGFFTQLTIRLSVLAPGGVILFQPGVYFLENRPIGLAGYFFDVAAEKGLEVVGVFNWHGPVSDGWTEEEDVALLVLRRKGDARLKFASSHLEPMSKAQLEMGSDARWHFKYQDLNADGLCVPPLQTSLFEQVLLHTSDDAVILDLWGTYQEELLRCDTGNRRVISKLLDAQLLDESDGEGADELIEAEHHCVQLARAQSRYFGKECREWQKLEQLKL